MTANILLYVGSAILVLWGIAHIVPTRSVVEGFGAISPDNQRIVTMTWVSEGLALCFIGLLVLLTTLRASPGDSLPVLVYRLSAAMLVITAVWTSMTGARTPILPMKICPVVKAGAAVLFLAGSFL